MSKKRKKLRGTVEKVIASRVPSQPEKAQISISEADDLYREIRVDNVLTDDEGKSERLEEGDDVEVTLEAEHEGKKGVPRKNAPDVLKNIDDKGKS